MSTLAPPPAPQDPTLVVPGKRQPLGAGFTWIGEGWRLFLRAPLMWVLSILVLFVVAVASNFIPPVGGILFQVLSPVIAGGYMVGCRALERGEDFEIDHLTAGFRDQFGRLLVLGVLWLLVGFLLALVSIAVAVLVIGFGAGVTGVDALNALAEGNWTQFAGSWEILLIAVLLATLVFLLLLVPFLMLYWFAPALIILHGVPLMAAMKASFGACLRNFIPFLAYGIVMTILAIPAGITVLGLFVWMPLAISSTYAAYRGIFTEGGVEI